VTWEAVSDFDLVNPLKNPANGAINLPAWLRAIFYIFLLPYKKIWGLITFPEK